MKITRRKTLQSFLFGAGYLGLRSLATGIPVGVLARGTRALADGSTGATKPQYFIMSTSGAGDPLNCNAPGTYSVSGIVHNPDTTLMPETPLVVGTTHTSAALPWSQLPAAALAQMSVWHIATETPVHPKEPDVLKLMGTTAPTEMLPSLLAKQLAPALQTVQQQPICLGATSPSEGLSFEGQALPILPPLALSATLTNPKGPLSNLQPLRDQTLAQIDDIYRGHATLAQRRYIDQLVISQSELRNISQNLLGLLTSITDNSVSSQISAALALIQMNVAPVFTIHIPFGGDNHGDKNLATEATQTTSGLAAIGQLMTSIPSSLQNKVSFITLNVFGRTMNQANMNGAGGLGGRNHNENHQVSLAIGAPFKPGIIGGVMAMPSTGQDFGAQPIASATGAGSPNGDVAPADSLASFGKTMMAAVGVDSTTINTLITTGKVVTGALV